MIKQYPDYKNSEIPWIVKIPSHWEVTKSKYLIKKIQTGSTPSTNKSEYFDGNISWFTPGDFRDQKELVKSSRTVSELALRNNEVRLHSKGTVLLVGIGATLGKVAILRERATFNQQITGIETNNLIDEEYYYYWLLINRETIMEIANYTTLPIINNQFIRGFLSIVPPIEEQRIIVSYLNKNILEINTLLEDKEKLIELLEEKRQAIITEAVTKGINPDVKMKDSGVDWIGEIPEHWDISRIKYQSEINVEVLSEKTNPDLELNYIDIASVNSLGGIDNIETYLFKNAPSRARRVVRDGDTIVSTVRTYLRAITWIESPKSNLVCSTGFAVLRPIRKSIHPKYLSYLMRSTYFIDEIVRRSTGVSYPAITASEIGLLECLLPPMNEQRDIVEKLEQQFDHIDNVVVAIKKQIEKLKEYRQSLIYEAVTGKIDVRDYI
ncbi:restriction endonuclease subunit S [Sediminibacillus sp. JSM 1682029]|uniref:restriction endonuclease subunit S n=1 Tax=Sediminibacillus sp. JSM 1682029 TaxID=3229857 RepID=UPI0035253681